MKSTISGCFLAAVAAVAVPAASQSGSPVPASGGKTPNIAVSGCLMRQGYGTLIVADARIDATGDKAASAAPGAEKPAAAAATPQKWVLDNAGVVSQHVGEQVQVVGVSEWVAEHDAAPAATPEPGGPPPPQPHIDVVTLKVLAKNCS